MLIGLEEKFNDYFMNFNCDDEDLQNTILLIENKLCELIYNIDKKKYNINSQLNRKSNML